jgi:hypothetical protein
LTIVIGVALLFQYNLKLNKLAQVRWIEDINDEEENEQEKEIGPIDLMRDIFPFDGKERPASQIVPKSSTYVRSSEHIQEAPLGAYVRSQEEISAEIKGNAMPAIPETHIVPISAQSHAIHLMMENSISSNAPLTGARDANDEEPISPMSIQSVAIDIPREETPNPSKEDSKTNKHQPQVPVSVGDIESDFTEDDSESYQESMSDTSSIAPAKLWRPPAGHLRGPLYNLRNN